jgi:hypothetical protein
VDPTNSVVGLSRYLKALTLLFDASVSAVRLVEIHVAAPNLIEATWTLGGQLRLPWRPVIKMFEGKSVYLLNADGLVAEQRQSWSISAAEALSETFTPSFGGVRGDIAATPRG